MYDFNVVRRPLRAMADRQAVVRKRTGREDAGEESDAVSRSRFSRPLFGPRMTSGPMSSPPAPASPLVVCRRPPTVARPGDDELMHATQCLLQDRYTRRTPPTRRTYWQDSGGSVCGGSDGVEVVWKRSGGVYVQSNAVEGDSAHAFPRRNRPLRPTKRRTFPAVAAPAVLAAVRVLQLSAPSAPSRSPGCVLRLAQRVPRGLTGRLSSSSPPLSSPPTPLASPPTSRSSPPRFLAHVAAPFHAGRPAPRPSMFSAQLPTHRLSSVPISHVLAPPLISEPQFPLLRASSLACPRICQSTRVHCTAAHSQLANPDAELPPRPRYTANAVLRAQSQPYRPYPPSDPVLHPARRALLRARPRLSISSRPTSPRLSPAPRRSPPHTSISTPSSNPSPARHKPLAAHFLTSRQSSSARVPRPAALPARSPSAGPPHTYISSRARRCVRVTASVRQTRISPARPIHSSGLPANANIIPVPRPAPSRHQWPTADSERRIREPRTANSQLLPLPHPRSMPSRPDPHPRTRPPRPRLRLLASTGPRRLPQSDVRQLPAARAPGPLSRV
ncbi:hypothetical protein C8Q79DRAFT_165066 [Trametes meyenii]|nr:hypothetical protein C8Q79DRAFT_165066 [Trametes meyenii]